MKLKMDNNSFHLVSDYSADIRQWMKIQEKKIYVVAEKLKLTNCTLHLTIKLLDYFMDGHNIQNMQLHLVSLDSLLLAAKMEEKESNVQKYSKLNTFLTLKFVILTFFNFQLLPPE